MPGRGLSRAGERVWRGLVVAGLMLILGLAASQVRSFDIFWQLQSGRYILETRQFIHTDLFTLAADAPRFEHCWLHDVLFFRFFVDFRGVVANHRWLYVSSACR
ncbi:hypothetical protein EDC39_1239 [Geothermobacter ehrlichii]|uniref:Uncharacterized protein n=1 Tax=Geothermobacter ehrlichii TaxID=213224 RepID=A0A5D3WGS1_9BACT|nr:hypothetical protein EDC39_1239 [Geothermobacter ehrlichii]